MACNGHTGTTACATHDATAGACALHTGECEAHSGRIPPGTETLFTDPVIDTTVLIKADHVNELKLAIQDELARRSVSASLPPAVAVGDVIDDALYTQLRDAINDALPWSYPSSVDSDMEEADTVLSQTMGDLRQRINYLEAACLCDCNYACTCDCDYACTCQCNYSCTCNCNYIAPCACDCNYVPPCPCDCDYNCTCDCNYACTCDCNYACTCNCDYACTCDCDYACTCNCDYACTCQCDYACTCDCDYCTCDCNYCTCDCNYACTCNCNYACTCNCNYTCTCNCNYSDERLKTDIQYL